MLLNFETIRREKNHVVVLDQTRLPFEERYIPITGYEQMITAIKHLVVRGAPLIGVAGAYAVALAIQEHGIGSGVRFGEIIAARPTAVNLKWAVERMMSNLDKHLPLKKGQNWTDLAWEEAEKIHKEDVKLSFRIGEVGSSLLYDGDSVLTHCNAGALATAGIGTALASIYVAKDKGKKVHVFSDETRPLLQGARLTTWELMKQGVDVTLVVDSVAASLMSQGKINVVIVGADRIAANGDVANKVGTLSVAIAAQKYNVPFYVAAPYSTFDPMTLTGDRIVIEERSALEVTHGFGSATAPEGVFVYAPAFDITPAEMITAYITDRGLVKGKGYYRK